MIRLPDMDARVIIASRLSPAVKRRDRTRVGHKKDEAIVLTAEPARPLKTRYALTPQGIRDLWLLCLLLNQPSPQ